MSFTRLVVEHLQEKSLGTGIVINETIKDQIYIDENGQQNIKEVARLSVIWENVTNPAINYHSSDELIFIGFYDEQDEDEDEDEDDEDEIEEEEKIITSKKIVRPIETSN